MEDKNYQFFISRMKKYLLPDSEILAYSLMPNHYHLLVKIRSELFPASMHRFALSYVVAFNAMYDRKGHLYRGPYQRIHIQKHSYLLDLSRYIHLNPVKAKLVSQPGDWKYSSYGEYIGSKEIDFISPGIILDILSDDVSSTMTDQHKAYRGYIEESV